MLKGFYSWVITDNGTRRLSASYGNQALRSGLRTKLFSNFAHLHDGKCSTGAQTHKASGKPGLRIRQVKGPYWEVVNRQWWIAERGGGGSECFSSKKYSMFERLMPPDTFHLDRLNFQYYILNFSKWFMLSKKTRVVLFKNSVRNIDTNRRRAI
jgi:hypothetical protein